MSLNYFLIELVYEFTDLTDVLFGYDFCWFVLVNHFRTTIKV